MGFDWSDFLGSAGEQWKPEKIGDEIKGKIKSITVNTQFDKVKPVLTIETLPGDEEGDRIVFASQAQLQRLLAAENPQVGDLIAIKFTGTEDRGKGNDLKLFSIAVKRMSSPPPREPVAVPPSPVSDWADEEPF